MNRCFLPITLANIHPDMPEPPEICAFNERMHRVNRRLNHPDCECHEGIFMRLTDAMYSPFTNISSRMASFFLCDVSYTTCRVL